MEKIFISYKREDKEKVFLIKDYIEENVGETCWIDLDGIESDAQFKSVIRRAVKNAVIFLFIYSNAHTKIKEEYYDDDWTIREYNYAKAKEKRIVFVNADGSPLTDPFLFDFEGKEQVDALSNEAKRTLCRDLKRWLDFNGTASLIANEKVDSMTRKDTERRLHHQILRAKSGKSQNKKLSLSYFTGERHSDNYERIIHLAEGIGYSVRIYKSKDSSQFDFLQAFYRDTVTIVDATIPDDLTLSTVYPLLTAHVNTLDHILVFSDKQYENNTQILPLNITPQRVRTDKDEDLLTWLRVQLKDVKAHQYYERFDIDSIETLSNQEEMAEKKFLERMEKVMSTSLELHKLKKGDVKRVMISYRNCCSKEVGHFRQQEESMGKVEIKMLPPGSICDENEALSPLRRWMLVGFLEDYIRNQDEVWVYYNNIYTNSWWTLAEMVMVAYINHDRSEQDKVKVKVYDAGKKRFLEKKEDGNPAYLHIQLSDNQHQKLARYLANTRPDVIIDSETRQHICSLKKVAKIIAFIPKSMRVKMLCPIIEESIPVSLSEDERNKLLDEVISMYCNPKSLMAYANETVFKNEFWNNISYQTERVTAAFKDGTIDVDTFMDTPMQELTKYKDENLRSAADSTSQIKLKGKKYYVGEGKKRYLWLATRMGMPTVKDAPGLEIIQTYNLLTHDQIVWMVMKKL